MSIRHDLIVALACIVFAVTFHVPDVLAAEPEPAASAPKLTAQQQARLDEANQLDQQMVGLYRQGKARQALEPAKKALVIRKEVLGEKDPDTATSIYTVGFLLHTMGDFAAARPYYDQALAIRREVLGEKHSDTANSINTLGALFKETGDYPTARLYHEQSLAINKEVLGEKHPSTASSLNNLGLLFQAMGDFAAARPCLEQALAINREALGEKHSSVANSLESLGMLHEAMGDYATARPYLEQALAIYKETKGEKHPDTATALNNLGVLLVAQGEHAAARPYYEQALAIRKEVLGENHPETAWSLGNLGALLKATGDYTAALPYYQQALAIRKRVLGEKHPDTALSLNNLGSLFGDMGDYAAARTYFEQALLMKLEILGEWHPGTALSLNNLGALLVDTGDYATARPYYERALAIHKEAFGEKHRRTAMSLNNLGFLLQTMGEYDAARPYYEQALVIYTEVLGQNHPDTALSLNNLGSLLQAIGDYAAARSYYEQALAIHREALGPKHPDTAQSLNNLGSLLEAMGDDAAARPYYEQALAIRTEILGEGHPSTAVVLNNLATLEAATGHWDAAARLDDRARRALRRHIARVLPGFSEKEQLAFLQRNDSGPFHLALSLGLHERQDPLICELSAGWLLNGKAVAQQSLAERVLLARETGDPNLAAGVKELIDIRRQLATLSMPTPKPGQEAAQREKLAALEEEESTRSRRLAQAGSQAVGPEPWIELDGVRRALPAGSVLVEVARFAVRNVLAKDRANRWRPAHYAAWIIPPAGQGDVRIVDLGDAETIDRAVAAARRTLMQPGVAARRGLVAERDETEAEKDFRAAPARLASLILHPVLEQIGMAKRLVVSPDAALWLVPWGALPLADGRYAIEEYQIDYLISGRDLVAPHAAAANATAPVVMADPDYDLSPAATAAATQAVFRKAQPAPTAQLAMRAVSTDRGGIARAERLPGTAAEARAIESKLASYAKGEPPTLYLGRYALEGVFKKLAKPRVLVLSTHGFFLADQQVRPDEPTGAQAAGGVRTAPLTIDNKPLENPLLRCGLLLAGCNRLSDAADTADSTDDGILTGMEIVGTDLRGTELVVLSACETGLGEVHNGEGVAGLRQAFQLAGAEAVVASLWQVPDAQTAELMTTFFANLSEGQSKTEALRGAQLAMIAAHRKDVGSRPFYWAAFTLTER